MYIIQYIKMFFKHLLLPYSEIKSELRYLINERIKTKIPPLNTTLFSLYWSAFQRQYYNRYRYLTLTPNHVELAYGVWHHLCALLNLACFHFHGNIIICFIYTPVHVYLAHFTMQCLLWFVYASVWCL